MADELTDEEWVVWDSFYAMRRRLDRALELRLQSDSGVSAPEYEILVGLGRSSDGQGSCQEGRQRQGKGERACEGAHGSPPSRRGTITARERCHVQ